MATKKNKEINHTNLVTVKPITENQNKFLHLGKKVRTSFFLVLRVQVKHLYLSILLYRIFLIQKLKLIEWFLFVPSSLQERLGFSLAMKKIRLHCIKYHIRTWCSLCLRCLMNKHLTVYMTN